MADPFEGVPTTPTNPSGGLSVVEKMALTYALRRVVQMQFLDGYKVKIGAVAAMLTGLGMMAPVIVQFINTGDVMGHLGDLKPGWQMFLGGWLALGFGHKMEKALVAATAPPSLPPGPTPAP